MLKSLTGAASALALSAGAAAADPAIWKASDADSEIWLFGSVHVLDEGADWRSETLETALSEADLFYYETPTGPEAQAKIQALVQQYGLNGPERTLNDYLDAGEVALLERVSAGLGMDPAQLQPMKPWLANLAVALNAVTRAGYDPQSGVELTLSPETPDEKERFFETAEQQIRFFADLDPDTQAGALVASLRQLEEQPEMFDALVDAWKAGDVEALHAVLVESMRDVDPEVWEALILRRNEAWTQEIKALMAGDEDALVIVGAGHLVGDWGVPALLAQDGVAVERVQ